MKRLAFWLIPLLGLAPTTPALAAQRDDDGRVFTFPLTREARRLADLARERIDAQLYPKAITLLQELLVEESDAVLPESYSPSAERPSAHPSYPGAGAWARATLLALPPEAQELYRTRYNDIALASLTEAVRRGDRRALATVTQRWPLTEAAVRAAFVLGDLELERGSARDALSAWERGAELLAARGEPEPAALGPRRAQALARLGYAESDAEAVARALAAVAPAAQRGPLPGPDTADWTTALDLAPFDPGYAREPYAYSIFPVVDQGRVFVSSTLEVFALDALDGRLLWASGRPAGWDRLGQRASRELFTGLDRAHIRVQPAVGGGVVVAALQLPYSDSENDEYRGIEVMSSIPQRRLFAFDVETGTPLWDHAPRLEYDATQEAFHRAGGGDFAQDMLVAGPPTIAGDRVVVPCYRLEGRIDYHVACYELSSGRLLWSTGVVSGQRSRNMFGRALEEFSASPLVVDGDRVLAQTELGTVAALDLVSGAILWEALYRQMALPKTAGYQLTTRPETWRLAPPAVADGVVLATPVDSSELTAFDERDGRVLWSLDQELLGRLSGDRRGAPFDCLVGAGDGAFYLGGERLGRFRVAGGLAGSGIARPDWVVELDGAFSFDRAARPLLCRDEVLVPLPDRRLVLDRAEGREQRSLTARWEFIQYGNPWVGPGRIYTVNSTGASGMFEWRVLTDEAVHRLEQDPDDTDARLRAVTLFSRRAEASLAAGETLAALHFLERSRELLDPLLPPLPLGEEGTTEALPRPVAVALYGVLGAQAGAREAAGRPEEALEALRRALPLAPTPLDVRDTLLATERVLGRLGRTDERIDVLTALADRVPTLTVPLVSLATGLPDAGASDPFAGAEEGQEPPVRLWCLLTRAELERTSGRLAAALADWHAVLADFPNTRLPGGRSAHAFAVARVDELLGEPGGREAYAVFEERARVLLEGALAADDSAALERLARCFPNSRAAGEAQRARLDLAYGRGDMSTVAEIAYRDRLSNEDPLTARAFLQLAHLARAIGNPELEVTVLTALARDHATLPSPLAADEGATVRTLLTEARARRTPRTRRLPRFGARAEFTYSRDGSFASLGHLLPPDAAEVDSTDLEVFLVDRVEPGTSSSVHGESRLLGFTSSDPSVPAFEAVLPGTVPEGTGDRRAAALGPDCIVAATEEELTGWGRDGRRLWGRPLGAPVVSLDVSGGVVLLLQGSPSPFLLSAFEPRTGTPLWRLELDPAGAWRPPVLGSGLCLLTSKPYGKPAVGRVLDLALGTERVRLDLGTVVEPRIETCAWITGDTLIVPNFRRIGSTPQGVELFDLTGRAATRRVELPDEEEFLGIARTATDDYLVTSSVGAGSNGGVYRLDTTWGSVRRVLPLRGGEAPIGLARRGLTELPTDELFTLFAGGDERVTIRSIRLSTGASWSQTVALPNLDPGRRAGLPAVAEETVAFVLPQRNPRSRLSGNARLLYLDRLTGTPRFGRSLAGDLAGAERIEVSGLGEALFLRGRGHRSRGWQLDILENRR